MYWFIRLRSKSFGDAEQDLEEVARVEGYSVDDIVELMRKNEDTMDMMRVRLLFSHVIPLSLNGHIYCD